MFYFKDKNDIREIEPEDDIHASINEDELLSHLQAHTWHVADIVFYGSDDNYDLLKVTDYNVPNVLF